jgi:2-keto-4-pentenoate hydratase/2-oxohepta-3-ene-1,7-dioic acid hydratase in catechol pathway
MKQFIRFSLNCAVPASTPDGVPGVKYGALDGDTIYELNGPGGEKSGPHFPLAEVRLLPPSAPSKIVCVGRNYRAHAKELGNEVPAEPLIFVKPNSSLNAHRDPILYPALSESVHFVGEIGLVIGKRVRRVPQSEAWDAVYGITCMNDVTARDLQKKDGQWTRGKGFDTFCCAGPWVVPKEHLDLAALRVRTFVNGAKRQDAPISGLIFSVPVIIEFVTQLMTLEPGDLIATGTPEGVGPLEPGETVRVEVEGVGALENTVEREAA